MMSLVPIIVVVLVGVTVSLAAHGLLASPGVSRAGRGLLSDGPSPRKVAGRLLAGLSAWNGARVPAAWRERLRAEIVAAGEPPGWTAERLLAVSEISAAVGLVLGFTGLSFGGAVAPAVLVGSVAAGAALPVLRLRDLRRTRARALTRALPHQLDLLTLVVEGGLDFPGALAVVVAKGRPGPLIEELAIIQRHLRMGRTREEALKAWADRSRLEPVQRLVTAVVQAERSGTGLAKVLRHQATRLRTERTQLAEKRAAEAPVKMLFPLVVFIFPAVFLVLLGPVAFQFLFTAVGGAP